MGPRKPRERARARQLRREEGMPIKRIAALLGVSPGSVHLWTEDIELTPEQRERNLRGPGGPHNPAEMSARARACSERARSRRRGYQEEGRRRAREDDPLHRAGCMLYWAEGTKKRNTAELCNSDVHLLSHFRRFLVECFDLAPERFVFAINVYTNNGLSIAEIERHWLAALELPPSCARKHTLNHLPTSSSGKGLRKLPHGVCTLRLYDTRIVQHIYGAIQEYAGFEEPRWLG